MDPERFQKKLESFAELKFPKPDFHCTNRDVYHDPSIEIRQLARPETNCEFCPRRNHGRYTFRRLKGDPGWHVNCGKCHRTFPLPKKPTTPNK